MDTTIESTNQIIVSICYNGGPAKFLSSHLTFPELKEVIFLIDNIANQLQKGSKNEVLVVDDVLSIISDLGLAVPSKKIFNDLPVIDIVEIGDFTRIFQDQKKALFKKYNGFNIAKKIIFYRSKEGNKNDFTNIINWVNSDFTDFSQQWESIFGRRTGADFVKNYY